MKHLDRILEAVFRKPWAILPSRHAAIREILSSYMAGTPLPAFDLEPAPMVELVGKTAVVNVVGTIVPKASGLEAACGMHSLETMRRELRAVQADPAVANIVLNIDSGGGLISGVAETSDLLAEIGKTKNVYSYSDSMIGSAAYWLASQAKNIFVSRSAEVGSIGVYTAFYDVSGAMEQQGVKLELIKEGKFKAMGIEGKPLSDEERDLIQAGVTKAYNQFRGYVLKNRPSVPQSAMEGQMFDVEEALAASLIDGEINELDQLIQFLNSGK